MNSLSTRLALIISLVLAVPLIFSGLWIQKQLADTVYKEEVRRAESHAKTLLASLKTLMLNGQGTLAREWLDRMKDAEGIVRIEILRRNGQPAFTDLETVNAVNSYLHTPRFQRTAVLSSTPPSVPMTAFNAALSGDTIIETGTSEQITVLMPIRADAECLACHGYDSAPLRGVLMLTSSIKEVSKHIAYMQSRMWMILVLLSLFLGIAMWLALRVNVLRPIGILRDAITRVGQGDRTALLAEERKDELGQVATVFNSMQRDLIASEARIRAIVDNLADAVITTNEEGEMVTVNPATEEMFGYPSQALVGQNVTMLMPTHLSDLHGAYMSRCISSKVPRMMGIGRELLGLRKDGSLFPVEVTLSKMTLDRRHYFVGILHNITTRRAQTAALEYQSTHDAQTGLPNHAYIDHALQQAIADGAEQQLQFALLLLDLDRFKEINNTLGHQCGDNVLLQVARRLKQRVDSPPGVIARLGGDKYAVYLPGSSGEHASQVAHELLTAIEAPFVIDKMDGQSLHLSASVGIALYPDHGNDSITLTRHADVAMYAAKRGHRDVVVYNPDQDRHSARNFALAGELRTAIHAEQLILYYQPKIDLIQHKVIGVEALVRWQHPKHGLLPPDEFIPLAEQTGLIRPLTLWVVEAAVRQCRMCQQAGIELNVAVNLSPQNLLEEQFPSRIKGILKRADAIPELLRMEITETAIMEEPVRALEVINELNAMGIQFSIDDFGTGYSSLAYLKQLPVDELKIDKSFVLRVNEDEADATIVRSTIELAHNMGIKVIAEGVENAAICELLIKLGCDYGQGHFFSPPIPADHFKQWLQESSYGFSK
ncbi:MAG: EAL domain-containing protein [Gammaproteobacteria bacterium]|nr:EAL domain-containing protein [Gammaproteobacteria bacterium]